MCRTSLVLVAAAVEATQLIVQRSFEGEVQPPCARSQLVRKGEAAPLHRLVKFDGSAKRGVSLILNRRLNDFQLSGVEDDLRRRLQHCHRHGLAAYEREGLQVRLE